MRATVLVPPVGKASKQGGHDGCVRGRRWDGGDLFFQVTRVHSSPTFRDGPMNAALLHIFPPVESMNVQYGTIQSRSSFDRFLFPFFLLAVLYLITVTFPLANYRESLR